MPSFPHSAFWTFSLAVYGQPGVPAACLELQERHGLDVNLVLAGLWAAHSGRGRLTEADWERLDGTVAAFHRDVVRPLRMARRALKRAAESATPPGELASGIRQAIKAAELDAEHLEQILIEAELAAAAPPPASGTVPARTASRTNILDYLAWLRRPVESADEQAIETLIEAAGRIDDLLGA